MTKSRNVTKVAKIPMSDYDDKLPYQESYAPGELLETKTHYRWKGHASPEYFAVPAFQLCPEGDELLTEYCFGYTASNNTKDFHKFAGPDEQGLYFDMPELKKVKGEFRPKNTLAGATLGSVQPGNTKLLLRDNDGVVLFSWNLTIWPSSFEKKEFQRMIGEILCIDRQLLQFRPGKKEDMNSASKLGVNLKRVTATELWERMLDDIEQDVIELDRLFKCMEMRPHFALRAKLHTCQLHQLNHIDQDILRQYIQQPYKQYYRTSKAAKSLDIYEHRFLKQRLGQLLNFFERQTNSLSIVSDGVKAQRSTLIGTMRQILREYIKNNQILAMWANIKDNQILAMWNEYVKKTRLRKEQLDRQKELFSAEFVHSYKQSQYIQSNTTRDRISFAYGIAKFYSNDFENISLTYGQMESIEFQWQVLQNTPSEDYLRKVNHSRIDRIRQQIEDLQNSRLFADLSPKSNMSTPWKMTQIFTNDKNYNAAYKLLLDMDKRYDFTLEVTDEFIIHEKLDKLYEYWILAKILEHLIIAQGWKSRGASPSRILRNFLQQDNMTKSNCISLHHEGIHDLKLDIYYDTPVKESVGVSAGAQDPHADELKPDFLFRLSCNEKTLYFILDAKYRDYAAMDGCSENVVNQQDHTYWWKFDMNDVCYKKYFKRLSRVGVPVYAAFIAHSDKKGMSKYVTYDANHDKRCESLFGETQSIIDNEESGLHRFDRYKDYAHPEMCRIGSFYIVPNGCNNESEGFNQSRQHLQAFFQMLCEDYAGAWSQCWQCGSTDVGEEVLHTKNGYKKYHLRCRKCHAFWVKTHCLSCGTDLVKHDFNHYVESESGKHWMVLCPSCGAG